MMIKREVVIPGIDEKYFVPEDISLELPENNLPLEQRHFLLQIPWDERYLEVVPDEFRPFFEFVLPNLHVRTTDVHTAICLGYVDEFLEAFSSQQINRRVVGLALTLHDVGWGLLAQEEVAQSLGVSGLKLTPGAMGPKLKHAEVGAKLAGELLEKYDFSPALSQQEKDLVLQAVLYHDRPEEVAGKGASIPLEVQLIVDLDHIWSMTHQNFWQDTLRKGVPPEEYVANLGTDLGSFFVTEFGKQKARELLAEREKEVIEFNG